MNYSIENVFEPLRRELHASVESRVIVAPAFSNGLLKRMRIAFHAWCHQGDINHVTGDINFIALAMDGKRTILTNHDCGCILRSKGLKRWLMRMIWLKLPVNRVAAVTTVSNHSKEEIVRLTRCPPEKIHVIPNPVQPQFKPLSRPFNAERPRILHVGTAPHKNLAGLISALAGMTCTLVIIGPINDDIRRQLQEARVDYENHVCLPVEEVARQYEQSDLVVFASLYEGFGLPIIEAQAVGRPLVTSNRPPMSDVAGGGACLVDPGDAKSIRAGIERIVNDAAFRSELIQRGFENIQRFRPERIAQQYLALYQKVFDEANCSQDAKRRLHGLKRLLSSSG